VNRYLPLSLGSHDQCGSQALCGSQKLQFRAGFDCGRLIRLDHSGSFISVPTPSWPQSACSTSPSISPELCAPSGTKLSPTPIYTTRTITRGSVLRRRPSMLPSPSSLMHSWYKIALFSECTSDSVMIAHSVLYCVEQESLHHHSACHTFPVRYWLV
jgi:hypothetical protein